MKVRRERESEKGKRIVGDEGDDQCGTVMDENLIMSSGSDYDPGEEAEVESEGDVSLEEENIRDFEKCESSRGTEEEGDDEEGEGEERSRKSMKRKRTGLNEGRRWRRKAAGDGVVNDVDVVPHKGEVAVSVRGRCTLEIICAFKKTFEKHHVEALERTILKPVLQYKAFPMQRELTTALVLAWVPRRRGFRIGGRVVPFSVFDVALFAGLPATGEMVQFGEDDDTSEVGSMVRQRMAEYVQAKQGKLKRGYGSKKPKVFRNYIKVMRKLCEANRGEDQVGLWLQLFAWMVMSGLFFPRTPYGAAWGVEKYVHDVTGLGKYNWAEAVWRVVVESLDEMQQKLGRGDVSDVQMSGFTLLIQVWFM